MISSDRNSVKIMALAITLAFLALICGVFITPYVGISRPAAGATGNAIIVTEGNGGGLWHQLAQLNVFDGEHNGYGEGCVVAPHGEGRYSFVVNNNARFALKYTLDITDENLAQVPMLFRLSTDSGTYLCGSEKLWLPIDAIQNVSGNLSYQSGDGYVLEWKWADSSDEDDTAIGILAQQGMIYVLNFNISAIQSGPAVGLGIGPVVTGNIGVAAFWIALVLLGFVLLFVLLIVSRIERGRNFEN